MLQQAFGILIETSPFLLFPSHVLLKNSNLIFNPFGPADQNKSFENSADPDEMAHNEPSHQDLHCSAVCLDFRLRPLFGTMVLTRFKDGRVHFRDTGLKVLKVKKSH